MRDGVDDSPRSQTKTADIPAKETLTEIANTDDADGNMQDKADDAKTVSSPREIVGEIKAMSVSNPPDGIQAESETMIADIKAIIVAAYGKVSALTDVGKSAEPFIHDYLAFLHYAYGSVSGEKYGQSESFIRALCGDIVGKDPVPVSAKLLAVADRKFGGGMLVSVISLTEKLLTAFVSVTGADGKTAGDILTPIKRLL